MSTDPYGLEKARKAYRNRDITDKLRDMVNSVNADDADAVVEAADLIDNLREQVKILENLAATGLSPWEAEARRKLREG